MAVHNKSLSLRIIYLYLFSLVVVVSPLLVKRQVGIVYFLFVLCMAAVAIFHVRNMLGRYFREMTHAWFGISNVSARAKAVRSITKYSKEPIILGCIYLLWASYFNALLFLYLYKS